ncbi:MAG: two-component system response regulator, partial [Gammaproteobacteria bacterium]
VKSAPGAGSRFWIALPLAETVAQLAAHERPRVVYVEDDPLSQVLVRRALADLADVRVFDDGRTALAHVLADPPALLLLDLNLPELDGEHLLQLLRQAPATQQLPVLVLSAAVEAREHLDCQGWLAKPIDLDALRRQVRALLTVPGSSQG